MNISRKEFDEWNIMQRNILERVTKLETKMNILGACIAVAIPILFYIVFK